MRLGLVPEMDPNNDTWAKRFSAWGALFVTVAIFALLTVCLVIAARTPAPTPAFIGLQEVVKALAMLAAGYWLGSSNSSQKKDETSAAANTVAMNALANSVPVAAVPAVQREL